MVRIIQIFFCAFVLLTTAITSGLSQIRLPRLIGEGMVLQRNSKIIIWGWASPGERISLTFDKKNRRTIATSEGSWRIELPAMKAGGPYTMNITGTNTIRIKNILIGDVWVCAGQSNMVHQIDIHDVTYAADITNADYSAIRHFKVPAQTNLSAPGDDLSGGHWQLAMSEEVRPFSAVAYFFARRIYETYGVPIGLINASVGGTPIEAWISESGFAKFPEILNTIAQNKDTAYVNGLARKQTAETQRARESQDKGLTGPVPWYSVDYTPEGWRTINIPGYWEDQGINELNGVVWYRREIDIPQTMVGKEARVFLGRIVDADKLYINGKEVAHTTYQYPQRRYKIPAGLLKAGKNIFAIRVSNFSGKGGFVPDKPYYMFSGSDTVDLKGYWKYKVGEVFVSRPSSSFSEVRPIVAQNQPTALYNAMVAPFARYPVKGILWYQGESNASRPEEYAELLQTLIIDWRQRFNHQDMHFIYAQLPNFMDVAYSPSESNWAILRDSQLMALSLPNTAMTVNIDLGEWNDIHPDNKKDVGERMALAASKLAYGDDVVFSGPVVQDHSIEGNRVIISFTHTGSGLMTDDGEAPAEFAVAGEDRNFVWANANIEGNKVIVWSEEVLQPKYVRYAWADNPDNPNLYNREGLPASPFQIPSRHHAPAVR